MCREKRVRVHRLRFGHTALTHSFLLLGASPPHCQSTYSLIGYSSTFNPRASSVASRIYTEFLILNWHLSNAATSFGVIRSFLMTGPLVSISDFLTITGIFLSDSANSLQSEEESSGNSSSVIDEVEGIALALFP
nr:unnamed protein product [Callosobruchus chinensis]